MSFNLDLNDPRYICWRILLRKLLQSFGAATEKEQKLYVFRFAEGYSNNFSTDDPRILIGI